MAPILPSALNTEANSNTSVPDGSGGQISIVGGAAPSNVDNALRSLAATVASGFGGMYVGATRPAGVQPNSFWRDSATNSVNWYDGAADVPLLHLSSSNVVYDTIAQAVALSGLPERFATRGYTTRSDGGAADYAQVASEPAHAGKIQINGVWYENVTAAPWTPEMFGAVGDNAALDTAAWTSLCSCLSDGTIKSARAQDGRAYLINAKLPLTGANWVIWLGKADIKTVPGLADVFELGASGTFTRSAIWGGRYFIDDSVQASGFIWDVLSGTDIVLGGCLVAGMAGLARLGSSAYASRVDLAEIGGNFGDIHDHSVLRLRLFSDCELRSVKLLGDIAVSGVRSVPTIDASVTGLCDTLHINNVEMWSDRGSPQGMLVDITTGALVNFFSNGFILDKSGDNSAALLVRSRSTSTASASNFWRARNWRLADFRADLGNVSNASVVSIVQQASTGFSEITDIEFISPVWTAREAVPFVVSRTGTDTCTGIKVLGGSVNKAGPSTIPALFRFNADGVSIIGVSSNFSAAGGGGGAADFFYNTTGDIDDMVIVGNTPRTVTQFANDFAYSSFSRGRVVLGNIMGEDSISLPKVFAVPTSGTLTINGAGAITPIGSHHRIDTHQDAETDDLDTINIDPNFPDRMQLYLRANTETRTVVVRDNVGNVNIQGNCVLDSRRDTLVLLLEKDLGIWTELSRSNN